jgi:hypothetical protein
VYDLLFADYTLICCKENPKHLHNLRCLFFWFEAVSRLKINLAKSKLVPVGAVEDVGGLVSILCCRVSSLPIKYLGLPLGALYKAKSIWDGIIKKMECHLDDWKRLYLFKGGRVTLIKS